MTSQSVNDWQLYICRACGLIYDEQLGDPDSGLPPGTRFEDIPDDWECPLCGVTKTDFERFERPVAAANEATYSQTRHSQPGVVIVGAGSAGWSMAEALRQQDKLIPITIITACAGDIYHKPELSIAMGRGKNSQDLVRESAGQAARRLSVTLIPHTQVVGVSQVTRSVRSTRGTFEYRYLVLALGAKGQSLASVPDAASWRVNHLQSWSGLAQKVQGDRRHVAIVGAGMVGCELAENIAQAGHQVTLIFRDSTPLYPLLPSTAGYRLAQSLQQQGVRCVDGTSVTCVKDFGPPNDTADKRYQLELSSNEILEVDAVVTAIGLKVDERLAKSAGLHYDNGIAVDPQTLQTSASNIYALGDCISLSGLPCRFIAPIVKQAKTIASQMVGESLIPYNHEVPTVRLKVQSCRLILQGIPDQTASWQTVTENNDLLTMEQRIGDHLVAHLEIAEVAKTG